MNHYTTLLYYIKQLAESDEFVHTVTKNGMENVDIEKDNIYPLVDVNINQSVFTNGQTVKFSLEIGCFCKRDINNEVVTDKFWRQDNEADNHNVTHAILNRLWTIIYRDFTNRDITTDENANVDKATEKGGNLLDGWAMTFEVEMPNQELNLCQ